MLGSSQHFQVGFNAFLLQSLGIDLDIIRNVNRIALFNFITGTVQNFVKSFLSYKLIGSGTSVHFILAAPADKQVVTAAAQQLIVTVAADQAVIADASVDLITVLAAVNVVVVFAAVNGV